MEWGAVRFLCCQARPAGAAYFRPMPVQNSTIRSSPERKPLWRKAHVAAQGHQPFQEGPEQYNALLAEFWSSVPSG